MKNLIRALGYSVDAFDSAKAFLESNTVQTASCLISDIHMPEMSGVELQRHLSAAGHRTPIIFMTARPNDATRACVIGDGAIGYLGEPLCERSLLKAHQGEETRGYPRSGLPFRMGMRRAWASGSGRGGSYLL